MQGCIWRAVLTDGHDIMSQARTNPTGLPMVCALLMQVWRLRQVDPTCSSGVHHQGGHWGCFAGGACRQHRGRLGRRHSSMRLFKDAAYSCQI